jgi:hypothetical protein
LVDTADRNIHLYAAGTETVYFQMVVPSSNPEALTLRIDPLKLYFGNPKAKITAIEPGRWRVFQIVSLPVKNYDAVAARLEKPEELTLRRFPDPLLEILPDAAGQFPVPKVVGENTLLLLEVSVPPKTESGEYAGQIWLNSPAKTFSRPVVLRTWGVDLPESPVEVFGVVNGAKIWLEHDLGSLRDRDRLILPPDENRVKVFTGILGQYCKVLDENGVEPWLSKVYPRIVGSDTGRIGMEWTGYRAVVETVLKNSSRNRKYWLTPIDCTYPSPQTFGPYASGQYRKMLGQYLTQMEEKILKPGLAGAGLAALGWPDNYRQAQDIYDPYLALAREVYRTEIPITLVNPFIPMDLRPMGWSDYKPFNKIKSFTRAVCPEEKWLDPAAISQWRRQGTQVWFRPTPAGKINYPPYWDQALAWTAWRYNSQGVVLEDVNQWQPQDPPGQINLKDSENLLVYPGKWFGRDQAVGSLRLKMIKTGRQDASYLKALEWAGKKELADWLARHLVRFAHTDAYEGSLWALRNDGRCNSDQAWALARLIAGYELRSRPRLSATQPVEADPMILRQKILLGRFKELTEGVALETEGVRAKNILDIATGTEKVEWTFHSVVRNFTDNSGAATLRFFNIPAPLKPVRDKITLPELPWAWPARAELKLEGTAVGIGMYGVNLQPLSLKLKDNTEIFLNARYCALFAQKLDRAIEIDGQFEDWPESPVAVAGNFQRIWPDGINDRRVSSLSRNTLWNTTVSIGYTAQNLYLGFTCWQPRSSLISNPSNTFGSSCGLPWDEDMIEVMIDPGNTDSFNPFDIYHLVIKANGNCLGLRGTIDAGGTGPATLWPNNIRSAVKIFDDRWQAEVAIPLADLGPGGKYNRWWGLDFARFTAAFSEMSTWSGAKNQPCKPISLGNVFFAK